MSSISFFTAVTYKPEIYSKIIGDPTSLKSLGRGLFNLVEELFSWASTPDVIELAPHYKFEGKPVYFKDINKRSEAHRWLKTGIQVTLLALCILGAIALTPLLALPPLLLLISKICLRARLNIVPFDSEKALQGGFELTLDTRALIKNELEKQLQEIPESSEKFLSFKVRNFEKEPSTDKKSCTERNDLTRRTYTVVIANPKTESSERAQMMQSLWDKLRHSMTKIVFNGFDKYLLMQPTVRTSMEIDGQNIQMIIEEKKWSWRNPKRYFANSKLGTPEISLREVVRNDDPCHPLPEIKIRALEGSIETNIKHLTRVKLLEKRDPPGSKIIKNRLCAEIGVKQFIKEYKKPEMKNNKEITNIWMYGSK